MKKIFFIIALFIIGIGQTQAQKIYTVTDSNGAIISRVTHSANCPCNKCINVVESNPQRIQTAGYHWSHCTCQRCIPEPVETNLRSQRLQVNSQSHSQQYHCSECGAGRNNNIQPRIMDSPYQNINNWNQFDNTFDTYQRVLIRTNNSANRALWRNGYYRNRGFGFPWGSPFFQNTIFRDVRPLITIGGGNGRFRIF